MRGIMSYVSSLSLYPPEESFAGTSTHVPWEGTEGSAQYEIAVRNIDLYQV